jgi:hypothetical protein
MFNSFVAKATPQIFGGASHANLTYLNRLMKPAMAYQVRQYSVAYNIKSKFEAAYEAKQASQKGAAKKM